MSKAASYLKMHYGKVELLLRSPGRINLIGEHVDYTGGHMLPTAIHLGMDIAFRRNDRKEIRLHSLNFENGASIPLSNIGSNFKMKGWMAYAVGVLESWQAKGLPLEGLDIVLHADLPNGAGLSSSAALTCGLAFGLQQMFQTRLSLMELAGIARNAEREYVGVKCGWMDQVAVLMSKAEHCLHFDTLDMQVEHLPIPDPPPIFLVLDTRVKHSLASSGYNQRVQECESILALIRKELPFFQSLREIPATALSEYEQLLPPLLFKRLRHIATENERVAYAATLLGQRHADTWTSLGKILYSGHQSLAEDYEVSCPELDWLVAYSHTLQGCYGARMMGGGFGGTVLALMRADFPKEALSKLQIAYEKRFYMSCDSYELRLSPGCRVL